MRYLTPKDYTRRLVRRIAWLPMRLDGMMIWLEYYWQWEVYVDGRWAAFDAYPHRT